MSKKENPPVGRVVALSDKIPGHNDFIGLPEILEETEALKFGFPAAEAPKISLIITAYNHLEFTFNCLRSIYRNTDAGLNYEVIVADDCSTDKTQRILSKIEGVRIIKNKTNLGFIGSCNHAAEHARGDYLVFLNNDILVTTDWLKWMLKTFQEFPDAGLVGGKLIYPDGVLQDAGGIVWRDGSAQNYGRTDDAGRPEYNYLREVDYCTGSCIMIPRELFNKLGKLDERYSPIYYDDTDLAFKVRSAGKKVLYQPNAVIVHFEGMTSGTDLSTGLKSCQVINHKKFQDKWKDVLAGHAERGKFVELEKGTQCQQKDAGDR